MPYVPRQATTAQCAHCKASFEKKHASRKYCSNSCNVQASYARNGRPSDGRATRADLEEALAKMTQLVELVTGKGVPTAKKVATKPTAPAAKAAATKPKPAKKTISTVKKGIIIPAPAAKAAATKSKKKKISAPVQPKPAVKAAAPKKVAKPARTAKEEETHQIKLKTIKVRMGEALKAIQQADQDRDPREVYRR
jgi:hypothetical protein